MGVAGVAVNVSAVPLVELAERVFPQPISRRGCGRSDRTRRRSRAFGGRLQPAEIGDVHGRVLPIFTAHPDSLRPLPSDTRPGSAPSSSASPRHHALFSSHGVTANPLLTVRRVNVSFTKRRNS